MNANDLLLACRQLSRVQIDLLQVRKQQLARAGIVAPRSSKDNLHAQLRQVSDDLIVHMVQCTIQQEHRVHSPVRPIKVQLGSQV